MTQFTDRHGNAWHIDITIASLRRVRSMMGLDLANITLPRDGGHDQPLMTELAMAPDLLVDVVYVLVKPQADAREMSDEQFGESLDGEALASLQDAFWEALRLFFHSTRRTDSESAIKKWSELMREAIRTATEEFDQVQLPTSGSSATNSPASAALTPDHSPSANSPG